MPEDFGKLARVSNLLRTAGNSPAALEGPGAGGSRARQGLGKSSQCAGRQVNIMSVNEKNLEISFEQDTPIIAATFSSPRHTTRYWEAGPADGPLMIFLHGWPQIGLMWRAQVEALASEGWHCVAPDMRGYGGSSAPTAAEAYALKEIVEDMVELHDHLGARPAIWVGHDWGSPVAGALAAHHAKRSRGIVLISVPYFSGWIRLAECSSSG